MKRIWRSRILGSVVLALTVLVFAPGCASSGAGDGGQSRDVLTRAQLEGFDHLNASEAIRRYRSLWLRSSRGQDSFEAQGRRGVRVYVDDVFFGNAETLVDIDVSNVEEIRFLDKRRATTRFGTDHAEGAILVTLR